MHEISRAESNIIIQCAFAPKISFALHQNSVPVLLEMAIENNGQESWNDLVLTLHSEPPFFQSRSWQLSRLGPEQRYSISDLDLNLDGGQLFRLTEAEKGQVLLELRWNDTILCQLEQPVELLARNQWGGLGQFPELAAAFVRPNDPAVDRVLKKAADLLLAAGRESALAGYTKGGKLRVWEIISAIWQAICLLGLDYALPPAGFEQQGQKVRSPDQIITNGLATCLDLSFLFASCLEQCQLNPLLVFLEGHAFAGVWLVPEAFSTTSIDDVTALRKRLQLQEIVLFEPTLAVRSQQEPAKFKWSCQVGAHQVSEEEPRLFLQALDIRRARMERILPLASEEVSTSPASMRTAPLQSPDRLDFDDAPDLVEVETQPHAPEHAQTQDRLGRWQRKLLDLSLRNNLLNFRASKRVVELLVPDPGHMEDLLADGKRFRLRPGVRLMQEGDPRDATIHQARHREEIAREHAMAGLDKGELFTRLSEEEMEGRLVEIFRAARLALQEGGANTLYLVLGFLVWNQGGKDARRLRAPLILIPVSLSRQGVRSGFSLSIHDDEPRFNLTLLEMLRQDFQLRLPAFEGELPRDDSGLDVVTIWRTMATAIKDMAGWEVAEEVCLGQFSFAKYLMWKDLADHATQLRQSPVVRHLIDTPTQTYGDQAEFVPPEQLDRLLPPSHNFCPLPADSSQLAAVMTAANGQDFVLEGPPGTGKSQTIANLIAQCLAMNKTILFVAEKTAALEVVYRRLKAIGLGEFCLELHSHKANKLEVLRQLRQSWEAQVEGDWATWEQAGIRMGSLRDQLNALVKRLHHRWPNGLSVFAAISKTLANQDTPILPLRWSAPDRHDKATLDTLLDIATRLGINATEVADAFDSSLALVTAKDWSPGWDASLKEALRKMISLCEEMSVASAAMFSATGLPVVDLFERVRQALAELANILPQAAGRDWSFLLRPTASEIFSRLNEGQAFVSSRQSLLIDLREQDTKLTQRCELLDGSSERWPSLEEQFQNILSGLRERLARLERPKGMLGGDSLDTLPGELSAIMAEVKSAAQTFFARLREGQALETQRQQLWDRLSRTYRAEALGLDLEEYRQTLQQAERAWWPRSSFRRSKVRKALLSVAGGGRVSQADDAQDLELLLDIRTLDTKLTAFEDLRDLSTGEWGWAKHQASGETYFDCLRDRLTLATGYFDLLAKIQELDSKLALYEDLGPLTSGLWLELPPLNRTPRSC